MSKIPFTTEQFLRVFEKYNQAIYPFQFALILVAIIVPIAIFIIQGLLFLYEGVVRNRLSFRASQNFYDIFGAIFIAYALVIYPLIGYAIGRTFTASPTFGVPCPTVIFTFGLLIWTDKRFPLGLLIIPVLWSLVGTSAAFSFGIKEDFGLLVAGTIGTTIIIIRHNLIQKMKNLF